jgi:hypothetical protein
MRTIVHCTQCTVYIVYNGLIFFACSFVHCKNATFKFSRKHIKRSALVLRKNGKYVQYCLNTPPPKKKI